MILVTGGTGLVGSHLCLTQSKRHANDSIHFLAIFSGALTPSDFEIFEVSSEKESVLPTII